MPEDVLAALRAATRVSHDHLETDLDIFAAIATAAGKRGLVRRFHGFHGGAEVALLPWLSETPDLEFEARRRSVRLDEDLAALGDSATPAACPFPAVQSHPFALGVLYVLEGSSLGGQVIRKRVLSSGGDMTGLSFLDPYGRDTGPRWKTFTGILHRDCPTEDRAAVADAVSGALTGFALARAWLCSSRPGTLEIAA